MEEDLMAQASGHGVTGFHRPGISLRTSCSTSRHGSRGVTAIVTSAATIGLDPGTTKKGR